VNTELQDELIPTGPGDVLRHKRVQLGLSLEQVAKDARIRLDHLQAIESAATQHIPQVYLNGYIRSYARFLGLPAGSIDKHMKYAEGSLPLVQSVFSTALPKSPDDRWFKATSYVLASVVVIALVWQFTAEAVRFSQGDQVNVLSNNDPAINEVPDSGKYNTAVTGRTQTPSQSHLQASIAPLEDVNRPRPTISGSGAEVAWSAISQVASNEATEPALAEGEQSFSISASADSWVEIVDGNGKKVEWDLLRAGSGRDYVALAPVKLLLGRASSIELTHNGAEIDLAPYTRGNVARITLGDMASPGPEPGEPSDEPGVVEAESSNSVPAEDAAADSQN